MSARASNAPGADQRPPGRSQKRRPQSGTSSNRPAIRRCAIYTRKSSDEGLDQAFNSLDAQREAGEAYVLSQAHEGWRLVPARYDDGGFSGGSMERPGLQQLLAEVDAGRIDVVVVYKIDRLTRSLADFARIVERFDARGVSFVSVTQSFNTTSSMGRLTLNVLLSFAQFEREVTGERIRDKIAASKARGMWMGGVPPLGYDLPAPGSRTLEVNADEAATVRHIFTRYLELGSVHRLAEELAHDGILSKRRVTRGGRTLGGLPFSRGALFHLLRSPVYLGMIVHKGRRHAGAHVAILDQPLFDAVQARLDAQRRRHGGDQERRVAKAPLAGRLFDAAGAPMSPTFSRGQSGRLYRYYVSAPLQQGKRGDAAGAAHRRVAAPTLEALLERTLARLLPGRTTSLAELTRVTIRSERIDLELPAALARDALRQDDAGIGLVARGRTSWTIGLPITLPLRGGPARIAAGEHRAGLPDRILVAALRRAHRLVARDAGGQPTVLAAPTSPYERRILALAFLAPDLQRAILAGHQPAHLNLERLLAQEMPLAWDAQRRVLAWPA